MLAFLRHRVGAKIVLGYGIALLFMMTVGYTAVSRLDRINSTVGHLTDELAVERGLAQDIVSQVWLVRFYANKYVRTQNQSDLDSFNAEFSRLQDLLDQADPLTTNAERREKLQRIDQAVQEYGTAFQRVTELIQARQRVQSETLDVQALLVDNQVAALRVSDDTLNNSRLFLALGNAQSGFQQMRLNVVNYLATNDESYIVLFEKGYESTTRAFSILESSLTGPAQSHAITARAAVEAYYQGFQTVQANNQELVGLFVGQLDVLEPLISNTASEIATGVTEEFKTQNESSQTLVSNTRLIVTGMTLFAIFVVLGLGIVFSRRITTPLRRVMRTSQQIAHADLQVMTTQLAAMAQGDVRLNLNLTAQPLEITSRDELGQMAAAFNEIIAGLQRAGQAFREMAAYLDRMTGAATSVAQGDLEVSVEAQSSADVLGNALAGMVANLRAAKEELRQHQEHLEKLVEERTRQVEREKQYFESLVVNSPVAIVVINPDNEVSSWNPAAEKLFGYAEDEVRGRNIDDIVVPRLMLPEATTYSQQTIKDGKLVHFLSQRERKDGVLVEVEVWGVPVEVEGEQSGALAIYHDITELQRARQEAETANRAKSAFLATMSHEIRTPMNGIIGMTSLLLDTTLTLEQREYAETIRHSGEALLTIINDILDFSKIEAGKMELENQPFDLRECIESALDLVASGARKKGLELVCQIDPQTPAALNGDATRLRQILLNLLSNAIKFTEQGEIVVSVLAEPSPDLSYYMLQLSVRDTGIGIPADRLGRLFQSFTQVDASTTRRYGGTGLGLAISQRLSELMGGRMWVESQVNQGSTFYFTVQAEPAPAQARVYLRSEQPQLRDRRVLIVDDNTTNRRVLVNQTRSWNMIPRETASPHEALEWIKQGDPFDLALLDMQMPDMDGSTLAAEIRRYRPDPPIPIVLLSSLDRRDAGIEVAHFNAYLIKPIKQSVLYNTLMGIFAEQPIMVTPHDAERESVFDTRLAERLPLRILIAEDNTINQRLALQMLRRMGYRADIAGNGIEVLQALERQPYDMILMDIHMPEMDGFEATRLILEQWPQNRPRIVAVTANAMQGDREECLAAGMDDYISKPIQVRELQLVLERWGQSAPIPSESAVLQAAGTGVSVDWAVLEGLQELQEEGEPDFVQETIRMYLDDAPRMINAIRQAIQQKQPQDLRRAAHTLKGNSNSLGAMQIGRLSLELEKIGRGGTTEGAEPLLAELEQEFDRVRAALQART